MALERMKAVYLEPQPRPKGNTTQRKFKEPEQLTQELEDAKKLIKRLQNDKIVLNTKLLRAENEMKRKDKQLEEIISNKIKSSSLGGKHNPLSNIISENTVMLF